jgi:hypothetical protein
LPPEKQASENTHSEKDYQLYLSFLREYKDQAVAGYMGSKLSGHQTKGIVMEPVILSGSFLLTQDVTPWADHHFFQWNSLVCYLDPLPNDNGQAVTAGHLHHKHHDAFYFRAPKDIGKLPSVLFGVIEFWTPHHGSPSFEEILVKIGICYGRAVCCH